jgi:Carbon monoxide dehydrogenase subunit G (CoxG)
LVRYSAKADIGGKLASIGSRLVQTVAKKNADEFFSAFARNLAVVASLRQRLCPQRRLWCRARLRACAPALPKLLPHWV